MRAVYILFLNRVLNEATLQRHHKENAVNYAVLYHNYDINNEFMTLEAYT